MSVYVYLSACMSACLLRKVGADSFVRICGRVGISQEKESVYAELLAGEEGVTYFVFVIVVAGDVACWIFYFIVESK